MTEAQIGEIVGLIATFGLMLIMLSMGIMLRVRDFCPWPIVLLPQQCEDIQATILALPPAHNSSVQLLQDAEQGGGGGRLPYGSSLCPIAPMMCFVYGDRL